MFLSYKCKKQQAVEKLFYVVIFVIPAEAGIQYHGKKTGFPSSRLCRNSKNVVFVILNEVKNLIILKNSDSEILRLTPQNDIVTQSVHGNDGMRSES